MSQRVVRYTALLCLGLLLCLGAVACEPAGPAPCDEGGTLFNDDFSGEQNCGWALYDRGGSEAEIADGALRLTTAQPGEIWWTNPGRNLSDVILTASVEVIGGPADNAFGLICRYQSPDNFYIFLISSDGYYTVGKYQSGSDQIIYLTEEGQYQSSEAIAQGTAGVANELRATCIGDELTLSVNGTQVATVTDPTFVTGDIGVAASTFEAGTLEVAFQNVRAIAP